MVDSLDSLNVFIEKGAPDGHEVQYKDSADEYINVRSGAVTIKVQEIKHLVYERRGNDLKRKVEITLREALLGFERRLDHLDGHIVEIDRTGQITKPGLMVRIKGEGMPVFESYGEAGDLLVTFIVVMPDKLTEEQQILFKQFFWSK